MDPKWGLHFRGIEKWKDCLDEVRRRWVSEAALPPAVVAARQRPDVLTRPAEMELATFYLSQRAFPKAEALLLETMALQGKAELRESKSVDGGKVAVDGGKVAVGLCLRGLACISEAKKQLPQALSLREQSLALIATALEATHPEVRRKSIARCGSIFIF